MHRSLRVALLSGSLALVITACGSSTPSAGAPVGGGAGAGAGAGASHAAATGAAVPAAIDSCAVLSDEEIEAGTREKVTSRKASTLTQVFSSVCDIELDGGGKLTVGVLTPGGREMYTRSFEPFIGQDDVLDEAVAGLGDKAARAGDDELMVLVDDVLFEIVFIEFGREGKLPAVRYLADTVVAKLPCLASGCPGMSLLPPPSAAAELDVCALLTADEVQDATGFAVAGTERIESQSCAWKLDTGTYAGLHSVRLRLMASGGRKQFDFLANQMFEVPPEHVPGLGDDAVKLATVPDGSIHAVVGDRLLTLDFSMPLDVRDPYTPLVPLVRTALSRL